MADNDGIRASVEARFNDNWGLTPIDFENVPFNKPDSTPWVRVTIRTGETVQKSLGNVKTWRNQGVIIVNVFTGNNILISFNFFKY